MITQENKKANTSVMLVDNSSIDNFVNAKIITRYQFADNVLLFTRAKKAFKYLMELNAAPADEIPSIIFLDIDMPEIDGFEFLNTFSLLPDKIKKNMKIVILTNSSNSVDVEVCSKNDSVVAFFQKPLIRSNIEALQKLLAGYNQIFS